MSEEKKVDEAKMDASVADKKSQDMEADPVAAKKVVGTKKEAAAKPAKKKGAKKKSKKPKHTMWTGERLASATSSALQAVMATVRAEYNDPSICCAGEAGRMVIGVPVPFAFQYLTQNDVYPLGRMVQVVGTEGTCKSALCFEIARWFADSSGTAVLFENETKYSPDFANSIMGYPDVIRRETLGYVPCASVDEWQERIQTVAGEFRTLMVGKDGKSGVGRTFPVLLILDSIMGKLSEESQANIEKAGAAGRAFPVEALMINNWLKKFPQDIAEWPMAFMTVNHLKPQKAEGGFHMERHKAGGRSISFQETWELEMKRDKNAKISLVGDDNSFELSGLNLRIHCKKNSLGETDRSIRASILWQHALCPVTNKVRQFTKWDWPSAAVDVLLAYDKGKRKEMINSVVDINAVTGKKFWSRRLGISKENAVPQHDFGVALESDKDVIAELQPMLGIKVRKKFQPGVDYLDQLEELEAAIARETNVRADS